MHTGEGARHPLPGDRVQAFLRAMPDSAVVACNMRCGSPRRTTAGHRKTLEKNGWTAFTTVDIMDEDGDTPLPVRDGRWLREVAVGGHLLNDDSMM